MEIFRFNLQLLKVATKDLKRSVDFFSKLFAVKPSFVVEEYGWAQFSTTVGEFAIYKIGEGGGDKSLGGDLDFHLSLDADQFDTFINHLEGGMIEFQNHQGDDSSTYLEILTPDSQVLKVFSSK